MYIFALVASSIAFINLLFLDWYVAMSFVMFSYIVFSMGVFSSNPDHILRRLLMPWVFAVLAGFEMRYVGEVMPGLLPTLLCWSALTCTYIAGLYAPIDYSRAKERNNTDFNA